MPFRPKNRFNHDSNKILYFSIFRNFLTIISISISLSLLFILDCCDHTYLNKKNSIPNYISSSIQRGYGGNGTNIIMIKESDLVNPKYYTAAEHKKPDNNGINKANILQPTNLHPKFENPIIKVGGILNPMKVNSYELEKDKTSSKKYALINIQNNTFSFQVWYDNLMIKLKCMTHGGGMLYLYHARKAAGTLLRHLLQLVSSRNRIPFKETEGILLDQKLLNTNEILKVISLRDPIARITSLYWYVLLIRYDIYGIQILFNNIIGMSMWHSFIL